MSQHPNPVDPTLRVHGMFRKTSEGKWLINVYMMFKHLPETKGARAVWYKTSRSMVQKLPDDFRREIREILSIQPNEIGKHTWISARSALVLLTFGSRNFKHLEIIEWVERYTGIRLPKKAGLSRREYVFGKRLRDFIDGELKETTNGDYQFETQLRLCNGRYFADFSIKHYWDDIANPEKLDWYLIEFDEEEHEIRSSLIRDRKRDAEILKRYPNVTIIRVKHDESDSWFDLIKYNYRLVGFEAALLSGILSSIAEVRNNLLIIDSTSAKNAYDDDQNFDAHLMTNENQPLRGLKGALSRCGIPFEEKRTSKSRQLRVPLDSFIDVLQRWWPAESVRNAILKINTA